MTVPTDSASLLDRCIPIRAVDIRDWGIPTENAIEVEDLDDLTDLYYGVDEDGCAL